MLQSAAQICRATATAYLGLLCICTLVAAGEPDARPVLVVFDFKGPEQETDIGRLTASKIFAKVAREKKFVLVEPIDVAPIVKSAQFSPDANSEPADVLEFARKSFGAQAALWGEVQLHANQSLTVHVRAYRLMEEQPVELLDQQFAVPDRLHFSETSDRIAALLAERSEPPKIDAALMNQNWARRVNLVRNGDFEQGAPSPRFWQDLEPHMRLVPEPGRGRVLKFDIPQAIAETYGLDFYSDFIEVDESARHRFSADYRSDGPAVIFFVKGYALVPPSEGEPEAQWREVYRYQRKAGAPRQWTTMTFDFHPTVPTRRVERIRVDLYAYYPPGAVFFDNIIIKKVLP